MYVKIKVTLTTNIRCYNALQNTCVTANSFLTNAYLYINATSTDESLVGSHYLLHLPHCMCMTVSAHVHGSQLGYTE